MTFVGEFCQFDEKTKLTNQGILCQSVDTAIPNRHTCMRRPIVRPALPSKLSPAG